MGTRTSDFIALTAILGGAGLGLGLTSPWAGTAPVARVDGRSVEVRVGPRRVLARDGSMARTLYFRSRARANRPDWAPSERFRVEAEEFRRVEQGFDREELDRLMTQVQELLREARGGREFEAILSEGLEALELLEDLDVGGDLTMTIDLLQSENDGDEQRRRRRRRPRRAAEVPDADAFGN